MEGKRKEKNGSNVSREGAGQHSTSRKSRHKQDALPAASLFRRGRSKNYVVVGGQRIPLNFVQHPKRKRPASVSALDTSLKESSLTTHKQPLQPRQNGNNHIHNVSKSLHTPTTVQKLRDGITSRCLEPGLTSALSADDDEILTPDFSQHKRPKTESEVRHTPCPFFCILFLTKFTQEATHTSRYVPDSLGCPPEFLSNPPPSAATDAPLSSSSAPDPQTQTIQCSPFVISSSFCSSSPVD